VVREFLGEPVDAPIQHPVIPSSFGFRVMGLHGPKRGSPAATIIRPVGCPMGCNFCTTSAFFGGKGKWSTSSRGPGDLSTPCAMPKAPRREVVLRDDENFLLYKARAMELLDQMKAKRKAWSLYVFSSANALKKYSMRELVELGVSWVWMGLESPESQYQKLDGTGHESP